MDFTHSETLYGMCIAVFLHACFTQKYTYYKIWPEHNRKIMTLGGFLMHFSLVLSFNFHKQYIWQGGRT